MKQYVIQGVTTRPMTLGFPMVIKVWIAGTIYAHDTDGAKDCERMNEEVYKLREKIDNFLYMEKTTMLQAMSLFMGIDLDEYKPRGDSSRECLLCLREGSTYKTNYTLVEIKV